MASPTSNTPVPDPTSLTTDQLRREIMALRELQESRMDGERRLNEERFHGIETQFLERDKRTEQTTHDNKVAVDAAFAAAKEAVGEQNKSNAASITKSEAAFTKQIDQTGVLLNAVAKATDEKIEDLKTRLTTIESRKSGGVEVWGYVFGAVGILIALAALFLKR